MPSATYTISAAGESIEFGAVSVGNPHAVLRVASTGSTKPSACAQVMAQEIRVIPPGQGLSRAGATVFDVRIPVCAARGHTSLSVQPVLARPGIPGRAVP